MEPIRCALNFPAPHTHYMQVRAKVPATGRDGVELSMAVWTPGSYLVREFSRHVEPVAAETKRAARRAWRRQRKIAGERRRAARRR